MIDLFNGEHFTHIRFACRIAYHGSAGAEECNGSATRFLKPRHNHKLEEMTDVQTVGSRVKAYVKGCFAGIDKLFYLFGVGLLRDQSACDQFFVSCHIYTFLIKLRIV